MAAAVGVRNCAAYDITSAVLKIPLNVFSVHTHDSLCEVPAEPFFVQTPEDGIQRPGGFLWRLLVMGHCVMLIKKGQSSRALLPFVTYKRPTWRSLLLLLRPR